MGPLLTQTTHCISIFCICTVLFLKPTINPSSSIQARWFGQVFFCGCRESFLPSPSPSHDVFNYKQAYVRTFMKDKFITSEAFLLFVPAQDLTDHILISVRLTIIGMVMCSRDRLSNLYYGKL
ncbi:hypothetical protein B0H12DRAFT_577953 [Mycena haematopus]|nr:hypothetical protein B0H12DRAFT_577953 [Mycena haematopus]